jgi:hypothetical protein
MTRGVWLSIVALCVGIASGLFYSWGVAPVRYLDTTPATLRRDFKDQFRAAIASAYTATGNLGRAKARLDLLGDANPIAELSAQAQRTLASGGSFQAAVELARLATDLQKGYPSVTTLPVGTTPFVANAPTVSPIASAPSSVTTSMALGTPGAIATGTDIVADTPTLRPTRTPIPTPGAPFQLVSQDQVCNPSLTDGLMQITVLDEGGHPMPGVELTITWDGGEDRFFTGLKPEIGNGYADYLMQSGMRYSLLVARAGAPISGLTPPACSDASGQPYAGGLKLSFQQP